VDYFVERISELTIDPNLHHTSYTPGMLAARGISPDYKPRRPPTPTVSAPSMMLITLKDYGEESVSSGYIVPGCEPIVYNKDGLPNLRQPVTFKHFVPGERPSDEEASVTFCFYYC
jgi:hypothetical protein